jgi:inorganic pyrophosphatase
VVSKPIGVFKMIDEKGPDDHLLCVPCADPGWNTVEEIDALPALLRREISHFFAIYKDLDEGRCSEVKGWGGREEALHLIAETQERFRRRSADQADAPA